MSEKPVVVIGAGLAGLSAAQELANRGILVRLLESQDDVGGRVRTDVVDGFRLDRGFQVLQTAYPEAQRQLDYDALHLHAYSPGALIYSGKKMLRMSDPWRRPQDTMGTLFNGIGNLSDRWKLAKLRWHVTQKSIGALWAETDSTTDHYLRVTCRFSPDIVDRFFRPWFSGVFLEKELATSSRFFKFIFRMFAVGDAALPEAGMGAIARQLHARLDATVVRLNTRVESIDGLKIKLASGETIASRAIVIAVEGPEASRLTRGKIVSPEFNTTTCLYFGASEPPFPGKLLMLDGDQSGPINNLCVPSNVVPEYAPAGQSLVSVSVVGAPQGPVEDLEATVRTQLADWFGAKADDWTLLKTYVIHNALPKQPAHFRDAEDQECRVADGIYRCGDYCETASIHGAMLSGRQTAEAVQAYLSKGSNRFNE